MTTSNRGTRRRLERNGIVVKELESIIEERTRNAIDYTVRHYSAVLPLIEERTRNAIDYTVRWRRNLISRSKEAERCLGG